MSSDEKSFLSWGVQVTGTVTSGSNVISGLDADKVSSILVGDLITAYVDGAGHALPGPGNGGATVTVVAKPSSTSVQVSSNASRTGTAKIYVRVDPTGNLDNILAWEAMFSSVPPRPVTPSAADVYRTLGHLGTITFPVGLFYFSRAAEMTRMCRLIGSGWSFYYPATIFKFPAGSCGLICSRTVGFCQVENLSLYGGGVDDVTSSHAIVIRGTSYWKRIMVNQWGGDGVNIDSGYAPPQESNATDSVLEDVSVWNTNTGYFITGGNAQALRAIGGVLAYQKRWCVEDSSGTVLINVNAAVSGQKPGVQSHGAFSINMRSRAAIGLLMSGTSTSGSPTITDIADTSRVITGQPVTVVDNTTDVLLFPGGTTVTGKTSSTVTLSANATTSHAKSILRIGVGATDTSIFLSPEVTKNLPSTGLLVTSTGEQILYTSKNNSTGELSGCTRGYNSTTAASYPWHDYIGWNEDMDFWYSPAAYGSQIACYTDGANATSRGNGIIIAPTGLDRNTGWTKVASTGLQTTGSLPNGSNVVTLPSTTGLAVGQILVPWNGSEISGVGFESTIVEIIDSTRVRISGTNSGASYSGPIYVGNTATDTEIFLFHKPYNLPPRGGTVQLDGGEQVTYAGVATTGIGPRLTGCTRGVNGTTAGIVRPRFSTGNAGYIAIKSPFPTPKLTNSGHKTVLGAGAQPWEYESTWDPNRPYFRVGTANASITELLRIKTRHPGSSWGLMYVPGDKRWNLRGGTPDYNTLSILNDGYIAFQNGFKFGYYEARRIFPITYDKPPSGTFIVGDVGIEQRPARGKAWAWVCTTAGTDTAATWTPIYSGLKEVNTTGLSSAQIDATVPGAFDGLMISDPTNKLLLVRQAGKWHKTAALTQIP